MILALTAAIAASVDWVALPAAAYDSDLGFTGGAVGRVQWVGDRRPYDAMLGAQVLFSTVGMQSHYLRLDVPGLSGGVRLRVSAEFHKEIAAPYYGLGNDGPGPLAAGLPPGHAFDYRRTYPQASVSVGAPLGGSDLRLTALLRYLHLTIDPYAGSLLAVERPPGSAGGDELSCGLGLLLDRRDDQAAPSHGYLLEYALRGAAAPLASQQSYAGATVRALGFIPLAPRIVLAGRVEGDLLTRGAPLFELSRFGGVDPIEGVGGGDSVRGVPRARYIGRGKLLASAELRIRAFDAKVLQRRVSAGVVGFVDTGRVWQGHGDGAFFDFHTGGGAGLRINHREMVLRMDFATSADRPFSAYFVLGSSF